MPRIPEYQTTTVDATGGVLTVEMLQNAITRANNNSYTSLNDAFRTVYADHINALIPNGSSLMDRVYQDYSVFGSTAVKFTYNPTRTDFVDRMDKEIYELQTMGFRQG